MTSILYSYTAYKELHEEYAKLYKEKKISITGSIF